MSFLFLLNVLQKLFRTSMLFHFINVLLQVLLHKSHDLLQEEIVVAIYNMASVDFDAFYSAFMPEFLNSCQGVDSGQRGVLARNFKLERVRTTFLRYLVHQSLTLAMCLTSFWPKPFCSLSRTCPRSLRACSGWWMTCATTDCVTVACPLAPSSYSTMTEPLHTSTLIFKDCLCWPLCPNTPFQLSVDPPIQSDRKEPHTFHGWVTGGWGCCWCLISLISTVEGWRVIFFFKKQCPPYVLPMITWQEMSTRSAVGCRPDLEQSEPGLLSHASATRPSWDWALSTHFEFFKISAFIHFCLQLFSSPKETDSQLKIFHIIPFWQR